MGLAESLPRGDLSQLQDHGILELEDTEGVH